MKKRGFTKEHGAKGGKTKTKCQKRGSGGGPSRSQLGTKKGGGLWDKKVKKKKKKKNDVKGPG